MQIRDFLKNDYTKLGLIFIATRAVIYFIVPFWIQPLYGYAHYLDVGLLKTRFWESLWFLHTQPPLFNAFLGIGLKLIPNGQEAFWFGSMYFFMGLLLVFLSFAIMGLLAVPTRLKWLIILVMLVYPPLVRGERWMFFHFPLALALVLGAFLLFKYFESWKIKYWILACLVFSTMVWTRNFFDALFWFLPMTLILLGFIYFSNRSVFKKSILVFFAFFVITLLPYVKNYYLFGVFTTSSRIGMNLHETTRYITQSEKEALISQGKVSSLERIPAWSEPSVYYKYFNIKPEYKVPALDNIMKSVGETVNSNNRIYIPAGKEYQKNTLQLIKAYPEKYLKSVLNETYIFLGFKPYRYFDEWRTWAIPRTSSAKLLVFDVTVTYLIPLGVLFMLLLGMYFLGKTIIISWKNKEPQVTAKAGLALFLFVNIGFVCLVANLGELKEGCYYRIPIDALILISFGFAATQFLSDQSTKGRLKLFSKLLD